MIPVLKRNPDPEGGVETSTRGMEKTTHLRIQQDKAAH